MKTFKNLNLIKIPILALVVSMPLASMAQEGDPEPKFELGGSVDAYYRANLGAPNDEDAIAPGSSFAQLPGFSLGMANLIASYTGEQLGFVADLVFGPRGSDAVFASPMHSASGDIVNQLYVYWKPAPGVTLTFGNFNTFLGYEVIAPAKNFNYSTSYLFSYGPFSHTGLKADFDLGKGWSALVAVMNPTDLTEFNPTGNYAVGGQLGYSGQFLNFIHNQGAVEIDYTGGLELGRELFLGINAALSRAGDDAGSFWGVALYPKYALSDTFSLGMRGEYFVTTDFFGDAAGIGSDLEGDGNVLALTLTGSAMIGDLILKPEIRLDRSAEAVFVDNDLVATSRLASVLFAAIYTF